MGEAADEYGACEEVSSFDDLFARYHAPIFAYLLAMIGDVQQAQALAQDAFLTAYDALPRTPDPALPAWLYRIATTAALNALRRRRAWLPFTFVAKDRRPLPDPGSPRWCAEGETVRQSLAHLSPRQRACLLLHAREGLSIADVAYVLGMSEANVARTLHQAKERFRAAEHNSWDRPHRDCIGSTRGESRLR